VGLVARPTRTIAVASPTSRQLNLLAEAVVAPEERHCAPMVIEPVERSNAQTSQHEIDTVPPLYAVFR
jgi:hypothetical protein